MANTIRHFISIVISYVMCFECFSSDIDEFAVHNELHNFTKRYVFSIYAYLL